MYEPVLTFKCIVWLIRCLCGLFENSKGLKCVVGEGEEERVGESEIGFVVLAFVELRDRTNVHYHTHDHQLGYLYM